MKETEHRKEMMRHFKAAQKGRSAFETWQAFIYLAAGDIATACRYDPLPFQDMYDTLKKNFEDSLEDFAAMFHEMILEYERDPFQDLLGEIYMLLGIGNEAGGQFFTPFQVSEVAAKIAYDDEVTKAQIEEKGYVSLHEPSVGSGGMVLAMAKELHLREYNYQEQYLSWGIDISEITALMCYVQLSITGCAAKVSVGDTLTLDIKYSLRTPVLSYGTVWVARSFRR